MLKNQYSSTGQNLQALPLLKDFFNSSRGACTIAGRGGGGYEFF